MFFPFDNKLLNTTFKKSQGKLVRDRYSEYTSINVIGKENEATLFTTLSGMQLYREICVAIKVRMNKVLEWIRNMDGSPQKDYIIKYVATIPELLLTLKKLSKTEYQPSNYTMPTDESEYKTRINDIIKKMDILGKNMKDDDIGSVLDLGYEGLYLIKIYLSIEDNDIEATRKQKKHEKGGFENGMYTLNNRFTVRTTKNIHKIFDTNNRNVLTLPR